MKFRVIELTVRNHDCINVQLRYWPCSGDRWTAGVKLSHDDVIKWNHFPRYWPFVRGIHRSPVNSPHKGQWRGALMFSLICPIQWINGWLNNREAGDLRSYRAHFDVTVMPQIPILFCHLLIWSIYSTRIANVITHCLSWSTWQYLLIFWHLW